MLTERAPAGGCQAFGNFYEGGQFLPCGPMNEIGVGRLLSPMQEKAAEARAWLLGLDRQYSRHTGTPGTKIRSTVTVWKVLTFSGDYGFTWVTICRDLAWNVYVAKTTKRWAQEDDEVKIEATVKAHCMRDGVAQTIINRVKIT